MTAIKSKRQTAKRKTLEMKQQRKHKWDFQEAWFHVNEIKKHLDSMTETKEGDANDLHTSRRRLAS